MGTIATPTLVGGAVGPARAYAATDGLYFQPATITLSSSYATGGDTVTLPAISAQRKLVAIDVLNPLDGTRMYAWDGSTSTPKIKAFTAFNAEAASTTNLSAVTLTVMFIWK